LAVFVIISRFITVYPLLYLLKNGHRVSLLTSLNLSNISEFSLVLTSLGYATGHIGLDILSTVIFVFVLTSTVAPYIIKYNDPIQKTLRNLLIAIGLKDITTPLEALKGEEGRDIAVLGFFRVASSFTSELTTMEANQTAESDNFKDKIVVIDFNPDVHAKLNKIGVKAIYGDISHMDTLHHANIHHAKVVLSTIPDNILVGTDNLTMIKNIKRISPQAKIIVTAESLSRALSMYAEGADYVFLPRILAAQHLIPIIKEFLNNGQQNIERMKNDHIEWLNRHKEQEIIS
jgi:voltage-gated potassium channel Kch